MMQETVCANGTHWGILGLRACSSGRTAPSRRPQIPLTRSIPPCLPSTACTKRCLHPHLSGIAYPEVHTCTCFLTPTDTLQNYPCSTVLILRYTAAPPPPPLSRSSYQPVFPTGHGQSYWVCIFAHGTTKTIVLPPPPLHRKGAVHLPSKPPHMLHREACARNTPVHKCTARAICRISFPHPFALASPPQSLRPPTLLHHCTLPVPVPLRITPGEQMRRLTHGTLIGTAMLFATSSDHHIRRDMCALFYTTQSLSGWLHFAFNSTLRLFRRSNLPVLRKLLGSTDTQCHLKPHPLRSN